MTRRQKKKRFKRKWLNGRHTVLLRTVPNRWKVSWADKINELYENELNKRLNEMILYGTQKKERRSGSRSLGRLCRRFIGTANKKN